MKPEVKNWLALADEDYRSSLVLFKNALHPQAVYHICQSVEKLLKAARLHLANEAAQHSHNLKSLGRKSGLKLSAEQYAVLAELYKHFQRVRYRDISQAHYNTKAKVEPIINQGQAIYLWILAELKNH